MSCITSSSLPADTAPARPSLFRLWIILNPETRPNQFRRIVQGRPFEEVERDEVDDDGDAANVERLEYAFES
jgi:hypothetical protein